MDELVGWFDLGKWVGRCFGVWMDRWMDVLA